LPNCKDVVNREKEGYLLDTILLASSIGAAIAEEDFDNVAISFLYGNVERRAAKRITGIGIGTVFNEKFRSRSSAVAKCIGVRPSYLVRISKGA